MDKAELKEIIKEIHEEEKQNKINKVWKDPKKVKDIVFWLSYALLLSLVGNALFFGGLDLASKNINELNESLDQSYNDYLKETENTRTILKLLDCDQLRSVYGLDLGYDQTIQKQLLFKRC